MRRTYAWGNAPNEERVIVMNDGWIRPDAPEDLGDSVVAFGALGLIAGTALGNPSIGVICGLILGAMADGLLIVRAERVRH